MIDGLQPDEIRTVETGMLMMQVCVGVRSGFQGAMCVRPLALGVHVVEWRCVDGKLVYSDVYHGLYRFAGF